MTIPTDGQKVLDKTQHIFMIKMLTQLEIGGNNLSLICLTYPTAKFTLNGERLNTFP